jgi:hypothetical protein
VKATRNWAEKLMASFLREMAKSDVQIDLIGCVVVEPITVKVHEIRSVPFTGLSLCADWREHDHSPHKQQGHTDGCY